MIKETFLTHCLADKKGKYIFLTHWCHDDRELLINAARDFTPPEAPLTPNRWPWPSISRAAVLSLIGKSDQLINFSYYSVRD